MVAFCPATAGWTAAIRAENSFWEDWMKYPIGFVHAVKAEFPHWRELHNALDEGSVLVGRYLGDSRHFDMKPEQIEQALNQGRESEIRAAIGKAIHRGNLHSTWLKIFQDQWDQA